MLVVLLDWIYLFLILFLAGYACLKFLCYFFHLEGKASIYKALLSGYIVVTIYAETFSLFYKVGILANILLSVLCACVALAYRQELCMLVREEVRNLRKYEVVVGLAIITAFTILAATPMIFAKSGDTGFYHAQAVHWIEEYGCTPGLSNYMPRIGFNAANFSVSALFGMNSLLTNGPLRTILPFLVMVIFTRVVFDVLKKENFHNYVLQGIRLGIIVYTIIVFLYLDSYSTEFTSNYLVFAAILLWLEAYEKERHSLRVEKTGLICLILIFAVTVKLNVAPMALLLLWPLAALIKSREWKTIGKFVFLSFIIVIPYGVRNAITSGWLLYPFTGIDIFSFDWKMPKAAADSLSHTTSLIMRRLYAGGNIDVPSFWEWFSGMVPYLLNQNIFDKTLIRVMLALAGIDIVFMLADFIFCIRNIILKKRAAWNIILFLKIVLIINFWFCIAAAPDLRYMCQTILPLFFIYAGDWLGFLKKVRYRCWILSCGAAVCVLIAANPIREAVKMLSNVPGGYISYVIEPGYLYETVQGSEESIQYNGYVFDGTYEVDYIDGLEIWYNSNTNNSYLFYEPFPAVTAHGYLIDNYGVRPRARGASYEDGFYGEELVE